MPAKLVAVEGEIKDLTLNLDQGNEWVIGRDPKECQLVIEEASTSLKHLLLRKTEEGFFVENLSEKSPIEVNKEKVLEPKLLKNGDSVKVGSNIFRFYSEGDVNVIEKQETQEDAKDEPAAEEPSQEKAQTDKEETRELDEATADDEESEHDSIFEEASDADKGILAEIDFDLREAGRWLLKVIGGPNNGAEFSLQTGESYTIGTDPTSCDIVFHDTSVSRQHARLFLSEDNFLELEDLKSRNGTLLDGEPLEGKRSLELNNVVSLGTTSFVVFDREGDMQTIISPLLPSIVKVLQKEDEKKQTEETEKEEALAAKAATEPVEEKTNPWGPLLILGTICGLFLLAGLGTMTLFQSEPVQIKKEINYSAALDGALAQFPSVRFNFTPSTGNLLLVGHVLTPSDKNHLLYNLQGLDFLKSIDDSGLIVDEYVWKETNSILNRDPRWKGISVHSPTAGTFVLSGYLQTRKQAEELSDYITANFPYLDLLERRVIVDEDVITSVEIALQKSGIQDVEIQMNNGELTISGGLAKEQIITLDRLRRDFRQIPGVRNVKTFIKELEPAKSLVNITSQYPVTGVSHQGGGNINVIIKGRILSRGAYLDGMTITSIRPNAVFLEKDGVKYKIDYNQK